MEIVAYIIVAVVIAGGALFAFRWTSNRNRSYRVVQRDIDAKGDVAGRDINHKP